MGVRTPLLNLAPLAGRGRRVAPGDGVQVSRHRYSRREPLTPTLSPQERGEGEGNPNTFAPEGASRCRALASGLKGRAAGRKERLFEKVCGLNRRRG